MVLLPLNLADLKPNWWIDLEAALHFGEDPKIRSLRMHNDRICILHCKVHDMTVRVACQIHLVVAEK
jgi:hypothetical protein